MSTGLLALLLASGCAGGGSGAAPGGDSVLAADPGTVPLSPEQAGNARFVLTSGGVPIAGQMVTFAIVDTDPAQGATLAASAATTDVNGVAQVTVHAGLETVFRIRATSTAAQADALIVVAAGALGSVIVTPFFAPSSSAAARATGIEVLFFDYLGCSAINPAYPPNQTRPMSPLPPSGGNTSFNDVPTDGSSAAVARALDAMGGTVAAGCVDLAGSNLLPGGAVEVALPLYDTVPNPVGSYTVSSRLRFSPPLAVSAALAAPWRDLSDCPLDPAQLWLDCTIDALSPTTAGDPLDCVPATAPGAEGPLGDALIARRGAFISDAIGTLSNCRDARDAKGAVSLDAVLFGLYGSPLPPPLVALPAIASDAAHVLDALNPTSTLEVSAGDGPGNYIVSHTLVLASLGISPLGNAGDPGAITLQPLGLPVLSTYAAATTSAGMLSIAEHSFTLHLGTVARAVFGKVALEPRGLPGDAASLAQALAAFAHSEDGVDAGCAAMDDALCPLVGQALGCLADACGRGLTAFAAKLDASFDPADGDGLDFTLTGSAPLLDPFGSGNAHFLGSDSEAGSWSVNLRTQLDRAALTATFNGYRK